ncbi:MAG: acyl transferase [Cyclobacteriaceae bacterium]|nr:acyl transferase [Cyclobacteriaceae bacterium]
MQTFESFGGDLYPPNDAVFDEIALRLFQYQAEHNPVYRRYLACLGVVPTDIAHVRDIPFLPISLFKTQDIRTGNWSPELTFMSSGTTGQSVSRHSIPSRVHYLQHSQKIFESFYGPLRDFHVLCLLPSYLERTGSSLVLMADHFIRESASDESGFFLHDLARLAERLVSLRGSRRVLLLGVTFALLDLAEDYPMDLSHCVVMETGGMKGRRPEITREELHEVLKKSFNLPNVHSEYGMTELLSQAYSPGEGIFRCPASMRVLLKEVNDPFSAKYITSGLINVVDLANAHSCAFIETQDLGRSREGGYFEVLGRMDASDARGCNLMVE